VTLPRADGTRESSAPVVALVVLLKSSRARGMVPLLHHRVVLGEVADQAALNRYCFTCNLLVNLLSNAAIQGQTHAPVF
jgi:hypothetical protein